MKPETLARSLTAEVCSDFSSSLHQGNHQENQWSSQPVNWKLIRIISRTLIIIYKLQVWKWPKFIFKHIMILNKADSVRRRFSSCDDTIWVSKSFLCSISFSWTTLEESICSTFSLTSLLVLGSIVTWSHLIILQQLGWKLQI